MSPRSTLVKWFEHMFRRHFLPIPRFIWNGFNFFSKKLTKSYPTVADALRRLSDLGIMKEITGRPRNRIFSYEAYLNILGEGT